MNTEENCKPDSAAETLLAHAEATKEPVGQAFERITIELRILKENKLAARVAYNDAEEALGEKQTELKNFLAQVIPNVTGPVITKKKPFSRRISEDDEGDF